MPEQALGGIPLDFGIFVEDKPSELSCTLVRYLFNAFVVPFKLLLKVGRVYFGQSLFELTSYHFDRCTVG